MHTISYSGKILFEPENKTKKHKDQANWKKVAMVVFDDDIAHIFQAQKEGYQVKYVGNGVSFEDALDQVLAQNG